MNNLIAFFEIPTVDFYRAINFYETILGLKLSVFEYEFREDGLFYRARRSGWGFVLRS